MRPTPNIEKNTIIEINRVRQIMDLELLMEDNAEDSYTIQTNKYITSKLILEQKELQTVYFVRVGFVLAKALKAANTKDKGTYDFGSGDNLWWKASHPNKYRAKDIKEWNEKYPEASSAKYIGIYNQNGQKEFYWEMGPFASKDEAIVAQQEWEDFSWEDAELIKRCRDKGDPIISNSKTIAMDQKCGGDGDVASEEFDNVIFSDSLEGVKIPTFDPDEESKVYKCNMDGCAAYVKDVLGPYQGNAWHAHRMGNNIYSTFENAGTGNNEEMETLFNKINKNPKKDEGVSTAKNIAKSLVPNQQKFSDLELDDVVGLFYNPSEMHSTAFFEGMTGYDSEKGGPLAGGSPAGDGPFMLRAKDNEKWTPDMLGQNIKFKAGNTLSGGKSPGLNTHLGFVGATVDGEPIIFHNIHQQVYATPLSKMSKDGTAIMWAKRGDGTTKKEVVSKGTVDKVKDKVKSEFIYWKNKLFN